MPIHRSIIRTIALVAVFFTAAAAIVPTSLAASITGASDVLTTLQTSQAANHTLVFTTPAGVAEGSTITVSFSTSFDTSSIVEDDVDIADDGSDLTTASTCAGTEQASVAMAADVATITICAGDGGTIAAGSQVAIQIGANATASGTGANRVTNPSSTGTYFVTVAGTFGDDGSIALPISGDDSVSVTGTIPSSGSGGGQSIDAGNPSDTTAPVISNIVVSGVTRSSATVSWNTSESATRVLDYGLTTSFELGTVSNAGYFTSHSVVLSELLEGTTYYFRIRASDISSNAATSATQTFSTTDATAPIISGVSVVDITTTSARVTWTTNEAATSTVSWGLTASYSQSFSSSSLTTAHSVTLTGLTASTVYHFQALCADASSNQAFTSDRTFTTDADAAPGNVSLLSVVEGDGRLTLSWVNPSDADLAGIRVLRCLGGYPIGPADSACVVVSSALATSLTQTGLSNGTTYYLGVFAQDAVGQFASGALASGTPQAPEEEVPSDEEEPSDEEGPSEEGEPSAEEEPSEAPGGEEGPTPVPGDEEAAEEAEGEEAGEASSPGSLEEPTTLGAAVGDLSDAMLIFQVADATLMLTPTRSGVVEVLPTSTLRIAIPAFALSDGVRTIVLDVGSDSYLMRRDDALALFLADLTVPNAQAILQVSVLVTYEDGSTQSVSSFLRVLAKGDASQVIDGEEAIVSAANVTLFERVGGEWDVWDGSPYAQFNPTSTASDGSFAWYVPNGTYDVAAQAPGFAGTRSGAFAVTNSIVNPRLLLVVVQEEEEETIEETTTGETSGILASVPETLAQAVIAVVATPITAAAEVLETIREIPGAETAAQISTPALAVTAGAGVVVLAIAFDFLPFLQYFFTAPILFFWRRKRKSYGVVYNAISKTPVDLATVRLFQIRDEDEAAGRPGRLIKSRVTDRGGRYFFLVTPGRYRLTVIKTGYQFPTDYLKGETTDGQFLDVYHGEPITVEGSGVVITANVPMDPSQAAAFRAPAAVMLRARLRLFQHVLAVLGVVTAIVFAAIRPNAFSIAMVGVQGAMYLLAKRLARPHHPINWGIVYDKQTGRPIARAIARIFEPKYNKVLETQLTDSRGRYAFLLGPNEYFAMFEKTGYATKEVRPIDYSQSQEPKDFSEDVAMEADQTSRPS